MKKSVCENESVYEGEVCVWECVWKGQCVRERETVCEEKCV